MRRLALLLLLAVPCFGQGQPQNVKGTFGYGAPSATNGAAGGGIGTLYTDTSTGFEYVCTAIAIVNGMPSCTWTAAGGSTSQPQGASYTIYLSSTSACAQASPTGTTVCARNNSTGNVDYSGSDAGPVINNAITNISSSCGTLYFRNGTYNFNSLQTESTGGYSLSYALGIPGAVSSGNYCEWQIIGESRVVDYGVATGSAVNLTLGNGGVIFNVTSTAVSSVVAGTFIAGIWVRPDTVNSIGPFFTGKNYTVRMPTNQRGDEGEMILWNAAQTLVENVQLDFANLGSNMPAPVKGTNGLIGATTAGPGKGWNNWKQVNSLGADLSYDVQDEITYFDNVSTQACNFAFYYGGGNSYAPIEQGGATDYHPTIFINSGWSECERGLTLGFRVAQGAQLEIPSLVIEENSTGSFAPVYRLTETNAGYASGVINYTIVGAGSGVRNVTENPASSMWSAGGQNFQLLESTAPINLVEGSNFDSFTHPTVAASSTGLGPAWQSNLSGSSCGITSNAAVAVAAGNCIVSWAPQAFNNDQFSKLTVASVTTNTADFVTVRASPTANTQTYYAYGCSTSGGAIQPKRTLSKTVAGASTTLATTAANSGCTGGGGDVIELDVVGTMLYAFYTVSGGAPVLDLVASDSAITSGRPGFAIATTSGTSSATNWSGGNTTQGVSLTFGSSASGVIGTNYYSATNCAAIGSAASPSVAACGSAAAGQFSCATNATGATCQVNTTAVTANSEIFVYESDTTTTGTRLGVTCNTSTTVNPATRQLATITAGTGFVINLGTVTTNPACFSYHIIN